MPSPAAPSPQQQQQQRNHHRTAAAAPPAQSAAPPPQPQPQPPQRPPRPVALARPSQGYPFPLMLSRQNTPQTGLVPTSKTIGNGRSMSGSSRAVSAQSVAQRRLHRQGKGEDGWDTPVTPASVLTGESEDPPNLSSAFSDSSAPTTPSSPSCSTPSDVCAGAADLSSSSASAKASPALAAPTATPADIALSRKKHAGSTPGAPPPAPLLRLAGNSASSSSFSSAPPSQGATPALDDVREEDAAAWEAEEEFARTEDMTPPSRPRSPLAQKAAMDDTPKKRNPLASGLTGFSSTGASEDSIVDD
ncbi:hypothetical protein JCM10207_007894 [Rhodosporidiobolus poonsookiae]